MNCNLELIGCWPLLFGKFCSPDLGATVVFRKPMFTAEESLTVLALERQNLFFAALLTLQTILQLADLKLRCHHGFN